MATKTVVTKGKKKLLATLVTGKREPCAFCKRDTDDEAIYGKLYAIGNIQVHYFCALLSCCLVQKGNDTEGLFGFLYPDIVAEVERSKKHKCSYCGKGGASLGCSVSACRKQFHLPCGREKNAVSLFFGNYKSFCQQHAPRQKIPEHIMAQARIRMKKAKSALKPQSNNKRLTEVCADDNIEEQDVPMVCVICYEPVQAYPCAGSFWPPCCARDAWFHRTCLQAMALSAGMHYLKCPLCNDKEQLLDAVVSQGLYVPDRDAAWELETNAFREIYERAHPCSAKLCLCPEGRGHDAESGPWDIQLCLLCGTVGTHVRCAGAGAGGEGEGGVGQGQGEGEGRLVAGAGGERWVCGVCATCAPEDITELATKIDEVIQEEQRRSRQSALRRGIVMPSRMSLRRTKAQDRYKPSTSQTISTTAFDVTTDEKDTKSDTTSARLELNLKTPHRPQTKPTLPPTPQSPILKTIENTIFSPTKLVEKKMKGLGMENVRSEKMVSKIKEKLKKPRPLCVKEKIANTVLDQLLEDLLGTKLHSPNKKCDDTENISIAEKTITDSKEASDDNDKEDDVNTNNEEAIENKKGLDIEDDSSNSTFQLPSEFVADHHSDDSLPLFETPKKLTTVEIQKDSSLEISENNEVVDIKVMKIEDNSANTNLFKNLKLKIPLKTDKCALKFSPTDKEVLQKEKVDIDVESFKSFYLNEVDRDFQCNFSHKHKHEKKKDDKKAKLRTAIDFAVDATKEKENKRKKLKRKLLTDEGVVNKKSKVDKEIVLNCSNDSTNNIKLCLNDSENSTEGIGLTLEESSKIDTNNSDKGDTIDLTVKTSKNKKNKRLKKLKKLKNRKHRENIQVKIRFREKQVSLEINTKSKNNKVKNRRDPKKLIEESKLKQYILQYTDNKFSPNKVIVKPDHDVTPKKRNYVKLEKSPDTLVQTSIQSFFKKVPATTI